MKSLQILVTVPALFLLLAGCGGEQKTEKAPLTESGMKCGAGKCGGSMADGNRLLAKKQRNILSQMREDDPRKPCVLRATTAKALYDCVRDPKTGRLTKKCGIGKCGSAMKNSGAMKCGAGKCGRDMPPAPKPVMKCGAGKCGGG